MDELSMDEAERSRKVEFLKYQIAEIESANIKTGEDEDVEHQYNRMVNSRDIVAAASDVYSVTGYESSSSAGNEIGRALASMKGIKEMCIRDRLSCMRFRWWQRQLPDLTGDLNSSPC